MSALRGLERSLRAMALASVALLVPWQASANPVISVDPADVGTENIGIGHPVWCVRGGPGVDAQ
jgi:hypothetical protein